MYGTLRREERSAMRDYKRKMDMYRLPKRRYQRLRNYCHRTDDEAQTIIGQAIGLVTKDALALWLYRHVTERDYSWASMETDGLPCTRDTFRVYRAKFYWELDKLVPKKRGDIQKARRG